MSTAYIYNGYGKYEERAGERGISLKYAGVEFWLPYQKVVAIPDWTFREVDQDKSAPDGESEGALIYKTFVVSGARVVEELTMIQQPFKNRDMGIIQIKGKPTGQMIEVSSGWDGEERANPLFARVNEVEVTASEKSEAASLAQQFKETVVQDYLQSKRERMAGGHGRLHPAGRVRIFMNELGISDIDDLGSHRKSSGIDLEMIKLIIEETRKAGEVNYQSLMEAVESVRKGDGPQLARQRPKPINLAAYKKAYDAAIAAGSSEEEAKAKAVAARDGD